MTRLAGLQGLEAISMCALLYQRSDHAFHHAVLLRATRRNELLLQAVTTHQRGVVSAGKDPAVVRTEQERFWHPPQRAEARDQVVFQRAAGRRRLAASRQMPTQQSAGVAVDHQRQRCPSIPARPDPA